MIILPFGVAWTGYLLGVYGWSLLKGWNITLLELANPFNPYQWPKPPAEPPPIPKGKILPASAAGTVTAA